MAATRISKADEGTVIGVVGGATVAVWFLIVDTIAGKPLRTPSVLGQVILFGSGQPSLTQIDLGAVLLYTAFHFIAFLAIGVLLCVLARQAEHDPLVRYAILIVFVAFEVFAAGGISALSQATRDLFPVWQVLGANTLAAVAMAFTMWRMHPAIGEEIKKTPLGASPVK